MIFEPISILLVCNFGEDIQRRRRRGHARVNGCSRHVMHHADRLIATVPHACGKSPHLIVTIAHFSDTTGPHPTAFPADNIRARTLRLSHTAVRFPRLLLRRSSIFQVAHLSRPLLAPHYNLAPLPTTSRPTATTSSSLRLARFPTCSLILLLP